MVTDDSVVVTLRMARELRERYRSLGKGEPHATAELMRNALEVYASADPAAYVKLSADDLALASHVLRGDIGEGLGVLLRFYAAALEARR